MNLQTKDYQIILEKGMNLPDYLKDFNLNRTFVITDDNVSKFYSKRIKEIDKTPIIIAPGEESKSIVNYDHVVDQLLEKGIQRNDTLIAFGGGVVGDLTGFIASTILRGIKYVQIPTTLLAMVDSSIGGKTSLNTSYGKNLVGSFYSPCLVLIDPSFLDTLSSIDYYNGMIEMIKIGAVLDSDFFNRIKNKNRVQLNDIFHAIKLKLEIVEKDFKDQNLRQLLSFGHTYGHAIEICSSFKIPHGIAVAYGMLYEINLAVRMGLTEENVYVEFRQMFIERDIIKYTVEDQEELRELILRDKKMSGHEITFIYLEKIGLGKIKKIDVVDF